MRSTDGLHVGELIRWYDWDNGKTIMATITHVTGEQILANTSKDKQYQVGLDNEVQVKRNNRWVYV